MSTTFEGDEEEEEKNHSLSLSVNARALKRGTMRGRESMGGRRVTFYGQFERGRPRKA